MGIDWFLNGELVNRLGWNRSREILKIRSFNIAIYKFKKEQDFSCSFLNDIVK